MSLNADFLISSEYARTMDTVVLPELRKREKQAYVPVKGGTRLYCVSYAADAPAATVLLLHGFTESAYKYAELIYSLVMNGFSVLSYDQRGHGRSGREKGVRENCVTHVDAFGDYLDDLSAVYSRLLSAMPPPFLVFGHSMGGAVAALYLESHPEAFRAAVLSSPMIAPATAGVPPFAAAAVCRAAELLGLGRRRPFFLRPYAGPEDFASSCATDPERFAWYDAVKAGRKEFQNSVPSYRWTTEALGVTKKILAAPEKIPCPVLLFTAEQDRDVLPEPQEQFISRVPRGQHVLVAGARHEIFRTPNDILFPWWHQVLDFLSKGAA